jgi:hypothetical protein
MRWATLASVGLSMSLMFTACGRSNPAQPTTPNSGASAMPGGRIEGAVVNTAAQGVPGSRVDIVQGPGAGTSVVSNGTGSFALPGRFAEGVQITLRASREGYLDTSKTIVMPRGGTSMWTTLDMKSMAPPADLTGSYLVTLTAADECSATLPEAVRSRTSTASIVRGQTEEKFSGTLLVPPDKNMMFNAAVAGTSATWWFGAAEWGVPGMFEDLGTGYLYIAGDATALVSTGRLGGALRGDWIYCPRESAGLTSNDPLGCPRSVAQSCYSGGHQILLSAR